MKCRAVGNLALAVIAAGFANGHASAQSGSELAKEFGLRPRATVPDGVPVRVVDELGGSPVARVLVVSVDEFDYSFAYSNPDWSDVASKTVLGWIGSAYLTDGDGFTRVAPAGRPRTLLAFDERHVGRTTLEVFDTEEHVIKLRQRELDVDVVDAAGKGQSGVPVVLGGCAGELGNPGACHAVTGADGRTAFSLLDLERSVHRSCARRNLVMLGIPSAKYVLRPLDAQPFEPVRFVLPSCGNVVVDLEREDGVPLSRKSLETLHLEYTVRSTSLGEPRGMSRKRTLGVEQLIRGRCREPRIQLSKVAVGLRLSIRVEATAREFDGHSIVRSGVTPLCDDLEINGPTNAGESVRAVLTIPESLLTDAMEAATTAAGTPRPSTTPARRAATNPRVSRPTTRARSRSGRASTSRSKLVRCE